MKLTHIAILALFASQASATQIIYRDLTNLVADADHVLIGTVTDVDMLDSMGNQVSDDDARTGPGVENQLRLHVTVDTNDVLKTGSDATPLQIVIPLWTKWHDTLGNRKHESQNKTFIFLLKGNNYEPVYYGLYMRDLSERREIEDLIKKGKEQNIDLQRDAVPAARSPRP